MRFRNLRDYLWAVLFPLSCVWWVFSTLRRRFYPGRWRFSSKSPIWSIGNLHSGGSGKTPIAVEIARRLPHCSPVILSRGYKAKLSATGACVDRAAANGAELFGDEPWMMAGALSCPIYIGKDRKGLVKQIEALHPSSLILLDDGFQHLALHRANDLVVINTDRLPESSFCLPLGDLREPVEALRHASAILLNPGLSEAGLLLWRSLLERHFAEVPRFEVKRCIEGVWEGDTKVPLPLNQPFGAFCGIAEPQRFRHDLEVCGSPAFLREYEDHHRYGSAEAAELMALARASHTQVLVTTDKDVAKVRQCWPSPSAMRLLTLRIRYDLPAEFWYFLGETTVAR